MSLDAKRQVVTEEFQRIQDVCWENGWTDGLPVVPPTCLLYTSDAADE